MFKKSLKTFVLFLTATVLFNSCIGSFGLFNKLLGWNQNLTGSKFLNELLFILISPAYAVSGVVDLFVLNTVEFWSGNNPVASNIGKTEKVMGSDGIIYAVTTLEDGYKIAKPSGDEVFFVYDKKDNSWSIKAENEEKKLVKINDDGTVDAILETGNVLNVSMNEEGLEAVKTAAASEFFYAAR